MENEEQSKNTIVTQIKFFRNSRFLFAFMFILSTFLSIYLYITILHELRLVITALLMFMSAFNLYLFFESTKQLNSLEDFLLFYTLKKQSEYDKQNKTEGKSHGWINVKVNKKK